MKTQASFYGWKLVVVLWLILFANMGFPMAGGSIANAYMASDLHLSRTTVGLAFAIFTWMVGLLAPLVALIVNKKGVRFTLLVGSLFLLAGSIIMALFVHTGAQLIAVFGVLIGLGSITGGHTPRRGRNQPMVCETEGACYLAYVDRCRLRRHCGPTRADLSDSILSRKLADRLVAVRCAGSGGSVAHRVVR